MNLRLWLTAGLLLWNAAPLEAGHRAKSRIVAITPVAVPVAVPVSPYSAYWYGSQYQQQQRTESYSAAAKHSGTDVEALAKALAPLIAAELGVEVRHTTPPIISVKCAKCHSGDEPKGGLDLTDLSVLSAEQRLKAVGMIVSEKMPKGGKATPQEAGQLIQAFSSVQRPGVSSEDETPNEADSQQAPPEPEPQESYP